MRSLSQEIRTQLQREVTATKFFCDEHYYNAYYAQVAGLKLSEINKLETELLKILNYSLYISEEDYKNEYNIFIGKKDSSKDTMDYVPPISSYLKSLPSKQCNTTEPFLRLLVLLRWWWFEVKHAGCGGWRKHHVSVRKCMCESVCVSKLLLSPDFSGFISLSPLPSPHPSRQNHPPASCFCFCECVCVCTPSQQ